jgi:putative phosphoribosyl transferase
VVRTTFARVAHLIAKGKDEAMLFYDRKDAGRQLATALAHYKGERCLVLALPRGGVPIAAEVAKVLDAPLDLIFVRKIGVPWQPELAMGAVVDGGAPTVVRSPEVIEHAHVTEEQFTAICAAERAEIERRRAVYLSDSPPLDPAGRVVIVIDDGIATGATMRAALRAIRTRAPKKLVMAVPLASRDALSRLAPEADEIVCLACPHPFRAVGIYYGDFDQVSDREVTSILARLRKTKHAHETAG